MADNNQKTKKEKLPTRKEIFDSDLKPLRESRQAPLKKRPTGSEET